MEVTGDTHQLPQSSRKATLFICSLFRQFSGKTYNLATIHVLQINDRQQLDDTTQGSSLTVG